MVQKPSETSRKRFENTGKRFENDSKIPNILSSSLDPRFREIVTAVQPGDAELQLSGTMVDFLRRLTFKTANLPYVFRIVFGCFRIVFGSFRTVFAPFCAVSHRFFCFFGVVVVVATSFSSSPSSSLSSGGSPPFVVVVVVV